MRAFDSEPFRGLDPLERYLFLVVAIGPYTTAIPGVTSCGRAALHEASGLERSEFDRLTERLQQREVIWAEPACRIFVAPSMVELALPSTNPNGVTAWRKAFEELIECPLKRRLEQHIAKVLVDYGREHPAKRTKEEDASAYTWILAWNPSWSPTFREGSPNVARFQKA